MNYELSDHLSKHSGTLFTVDILPASGVGFLPAKTCTSRHEV